MDVVTLGETMVLFVPTETGPLKYIYQFNKHIGGAESNVAIGLSKLGVKAGWISKLGKMDLGIISNLLLEVKVSMYHK